MSWRLLFGEWILTGEVFDEVITGEGSKWGMLHVSAIEGSV